MAYRMRRRDGTIRGPMRTEDSILRAECGHVRIHRIWTPNARSSVFVLLLLAVGIIISWVFLLVLLFVFIQAAVGWDVDLPGWLPVSVCIAALSGPVALLFLQDKIRHRRLMRRPRYREERLRHLAENPLTRTRFPHRLVERALRTWGRPIRNCNETLQEIESSNLIVVNAATRSANIRPVPTDIAFEPIDLSRDFERCAWFTVQNLEAQGCNIEDEVEKDREKRSKLQSIWLVVHPWTTYAIYMFVVSFGVYATLISRDQWQWQIYIAALAIACVLLPRILPSVWGAQWWLVPGGLVLRRQRSWRRSDIIEFFASNKSALMLEARRGYGLVSTGSRVRRFRFDRRTGWAILSGWISVAPRPTNDEILTFFGPHSDLINKA